jgi:hypothetical protein
MRGGRIELSAKLPGVTSAINPDSSTPNARVSPSGKYYPTWPGAWLMGNLGRALFLSSTTRMWPWSYNTCDDLSRSSQRISACESSPGFGLNANQGRGAPEIDIFEGGGDMISSSIQVGPGMPDQYRIAPAKAPDSFSCVYSSTCTTPGTMMLE